MSVQLRISGSIICGIIAASVLILTANTFIYSSSYHNEMARESRSVMLMAQNEIAHMKDKSFYAALYFAHDTELADAIERNDLGTILNRAGFLYSETDVEFCVFVDVEGMVIARLNEVYGGQDDLSDIPGITAALQGYSYTSIDTNRHTNMSVISVNPLYSRHGELLGAVLTGFRLDTDTFVDKMKDLTGFEFSVYRTTISRVATTFLNNDGSRALNVPPHSTGLNNARYRLDNVVEDFFNGKRMLARFSALVGANDSMVGILFTGKDYEARSLAVRRFVTMGIFITAAIICIMIPVIWKTVKHISKPIEESLDKILYDPLTGLHNRRYLNEKLGGLVKSLSRSNSYLSVMMLDIDCFKLYNDNYGHAEGDKCLKTVADVLSRCVDRAEDFIVRYGGEEFTLVLPNTNEAGAKKIATKILERIRARQIPHEKSFVTGHVTLSLGVVTGKVLPTHTSEDYIKQADELLYMSKQNGRNRFTFKNF
jgi:diguanylate cyclase (GGDEF)-like protein